MPVTMVLKVGPPNQKYLYHVRICQKNGDLRGHTRFLHLCFNKPPRCLIMLTLQFVNHWSKTELGDKIRKSKIQVSGYKLLKAPDSVILAIMCEEGETRKWFSSHRLPWEPWWPTLRTTTKTWKKFKGSNFHVSARGSHGRHWKSLAFWIFLTGKPNFFLGYLLEAEFKLSILGTREREREDSDKDKHREQ